MTSNTLIPPDNCVVVIASGRAKASVETAQPGADGYTTTIGHDAEAQNYLMFRSGPGAHVRVDAWDLIEHGETWGSGLIDPACMRLPDRQAGMVFAYTPDGNLHVINETWEWTWP